MGIDAHRGVILEPLLLHCNDIATIIVTEFYSPLCESILNGCEAWGGLKTTNAGNKIVSNSFYKTMNFA